jgi:hypothetical protein
MKADKPTHRWVKTPEINARYLADFMAASEQAKRSLIQKCKFPAIARVVQHTEAQAIITNFWLELNPDKKKHLEDKAVWLRNKLADDQFEEDVNEHNADYVDCFAGQVDKISFPESERLPAPKFAPLMLEGTRFKFKPNLILSRRTKSNKLKVGAVMLRYGKGKPLSPEVGKWQSAAAHGYLKAIFTKEEREPELKLCLTVDALTGETYEAPSNSGYRFNEIKAACASIAERWPLVKPPKNAVL